MNSTLITNEVKNAAGTEVEFKLLSSIGRSKEYAKVGEAPGYPARIFLSHQETGSGISRVRRSVVRVNVTHVGQVDATKSVTTSFYVVGVLPVGQLTAMTVPKDVLAHLISVLASTGADTVVKFDCSGTAAVDLIDGSI